MKKKQKIEKARAKRASQEQRKVESKGQPKRAVRPSDDREAFKHKQMVTTAKWNRYMLIRYLDSGLFFIGLYWTVMLFATGSSLAALIAPIVDFATGLVVLLEVNRVLTHDIEYLKVSHRTLEVSVACSLAELALTAFMGKDLLFPFFSSSAIGMGLLAVLIVLKAVIIWRIVLVRDRRDKKRYNLYLMQLDYAEDSKGR